ELTVRRGKGENAETVSFTLTADSNRGGMAPVSELASDIASAPLGIALQPTAVFSRVDDSLNRDGRDKIAVGDELKEVRAVWKNGKLPEALESQLSEQAIIRLNQGWDLDSPGSINALVSLLQFLPEGTEFEAFVRRGTDSRVLETTLTVNDMDGVFWFRRGLALQRSEAIQTARSVGQAVSLGLREGGRRLNDVVGFLGLLVQGKIKAKFVGGPIRIVEMAGVQARQGVSKQLLFLTMLSMNLAILNFLPIPALDGGHMMFLTAELVRGKRVDEQLEMKLTLAGVLAILSLMIFVFANDIFQITR
ncbi:MAG: site-2 protease family protein, partial [Planctomycetota bacterium]